MGQITTLLVQLGVNQTFFIMFAIFGGTYIVVSSLLTKPLGNLLVERDRRILGRREQVLGIKVELVDIQEKLAAERRKAQAEANTKFGELKTSAVTEQRKILAEARENFAGQVKVAREKTEKMLDDERQKIDRLSGDLKDDIVSKLLGVSTNKQTTVGKEI